MKKQFRRYLASLLIMIFLVNSLQIPTFAEQVDSGASVSDDIQYEVQGNDAAGNLIANAIETENASTYSEGNTFILDVTVDGNMAAVTFASEEDADLVVAVYSDDAEKRLAASGKVRITAEDNKANVLLEGSIPEYFMISAFLLDPDTHSPLCDACHVNMYTRQMQDFLSKTVEDYDEDLVVNFDNNSDTNFAVYRSDVTLVPSSDTLNTICQNEDGTYTILNAGQEVLNLQQGDILVCGDEDGLIVKVQTIRFPDASSVIITPDDTLNYEDVFSYIRLDTNYYEGTAGEQTASMYSVNELQEFNALAQDSGSEGLELSHTSSAARSFEKKVGSGNSELNVKGVLKLTVSLSFYFEELWNDCVVKFTVLSYGNLTVTVSGSISGEVALPEMVIPVNASVNVYVKPVFVYSVSGKITFSGTLTEVDGFVYSQGQFRENHQNPKLVTTLDIETDFYIGFRLEPSVAWVLAQVRIVQIQMPVEVGIDVSAQLSITSEREEGEEIIHSCAKCIDGVVNFKVKSQAKFKVIGMSDFKSFTIYNNTYKYKDFYYSFEHREFGWTTCPHLKYRISLTVEDADGKPVEGAFIEKTDNSEVLEPDSETDAKGHAVFYVSSGKHQIQISKDGIKKTEKFTVADHGVTLKSILDLQYKVTVHVINQDGEDVSGALVFGPDLEKSCYTDSKGIAEIQLVNGDHTIKVSKDENQVTDTVTVHGEDSTVTILLKGKYKVEMTVLDADGVPLSGAVISGLPQGSSMLTDNQGMAELSLANGRYDLIISSNGNTVTKTVLVNGEDQKITVCFKKYTVTVRVTDSDGKIVPGAFVTIMDTNNNGEITDTNQTDSQGIAVFDLLSGSYTANAQMDTNAGKTGFSVGDANRSVSVTITRNTVRLGDNIVWARDPGGYGLNMWYSFTPDSTGYYTFFSEKNVAASADGGVCGVLQMCFLGDDSMGYWEWNDVRDLSRWESDYIDITTGTDKTGGSFICYFKLLENGGYKYCRYTLYLEAGKTYSFEMIGDASWEHLTVSKEASAVVSDVNSVNELEESSTAEEAPFKDTVVEDQTDQFGADDVWIEESPETETPEMPSEEPESESPEASVEEPEVSAGEPESETPEASVEVFEEEEWAEEHDETGVSENTGIVFGDGNNVIDVSAESTNIIRKDDNVFPEIVTLDISEETSDESEHVIAALSASEILDSGRVYTPVSLQQKHCYELIPGERYLFLVFADPNAEDLLAFDNLFYISQEIADEHGEIVVEYVPRNDGGTCGIYGYPDRQIEEAVISVLGAPFYYEGSEIKPELKVVYNSRELIQDRDYIAYFFHNDNYGTATVYLIGTGRYRGTITATFELEEKEHSWSSWEIDSESTCTGQGREKRSCTHCKEEEYREIPAAGHSWSSWETYRESTCTDKGKERRSCTRCNEEEYRETPALGHSYQTETVKATTKKNGSIRKVCTGCGYVDSRTIIYYPKKVILSKESFVYSGKVRKPSVTVKGADGKNIGASNYRITYSKDCKNIGQYFVNITFYGKYSGSIKKSFTIIPQGTSIKKLSALSKGFAAIWKKQTTKTTGYQIQYSTSSKFKNAKLITVNKNTAVSLNVKKLLKNKKYYVRVRTYKKVGKKNYYSAWSSAKSVMTKK